MNGFDHYAAALLPTIPCILHATYFILHLMDAKDEVKQRLSVEDVIGDYLELKRAGRNWKAISPFTSEKTASFMVSPEKQIWHDFSSNKGGDIFTFVMEVEGVEFREALEILARKANVDLSQYQRKGGSNSNLKKRLGEANQLAAQFYHLCLSKKPEALDYIKTKRRFSVATIRQWQLGYSPDDGKSLLSFLVKRGFNTTELSKAGLITQRRGGFGDMFRGRIMIPLSDGQGNVVGFTARLLKDDPQAPKYFNTPQTLIYDKGRQVFGFHHAKEQIRKQDSTVLVEGNLDVISSHQAGVKNVVAAAGTAMTADHLRSLSRLSPNVNLAFDADEAGLKATERAIPIAQATGVNLGIITLPKQAKDPDDLIQKDPKLWEQAVNQPEDAVTWILHHYTKLFDKNTAAGKRQISTKALAVIAGLDDPVEREHHIKNLAAALEISVTALVQKFRQRKQPIKRLKTVNVKTATPDETMFEDDFLALNLVYPAVRDSLKPLLGKHFHTDDRQQLFTRLQELPAKQIINEESASDLHLDQNYVKILWFTAEEKYAGFSPAEIMAETMALARRIQKEAQTQDKNRLTAAIAEAEASGDQAKVAQLLEEYQALIRK